MHRMEIAKRKSQDWEAMRQHLANNVSVQALYHFLRCQIAAGFLDLDLSLQQQCTP